MSMWESASDQDFDRVTGNADRWEHSQELEVQDIMDYWDRCHAELAADPYYQQWLDEQREPPYPEQQEPDISF